MGFLDHLEELRKRIVYSIIAVVIGFFGCWFAASRLVGIMQRPIIDVLHKYGLPEKLRPTHNKNLFISGASGNGFIQRMRDDAARNFQVGIARNDDGGASRQRFADGIESLASHDHVMAHGERLKILEVFRAAPGQGVVHADGAVLRHGDTWTILSHAGASNRSGRLGSNAT